MSLSQVQLGEGAEDTRLSGLLGKRRMLDSLGFAEELSSAITREIYVGFRCAPEHAFEELPHKGPHTAGRPHNME